MLVACPAQRHACTALCVASSGFIFGRSGCSGVQRRPWPRDGLCRSFRDAFKTTRLVTRPSTVSMCLSVAVSIPPSLLRSLFSQGCFGNLRDAVRAHTHQNTTHQNTTPLHPHTRTPHLCMTRSLPVVRLDGPQPARQADEKTLHRGVLE